MNKPENNGDPDRDFELMRQVSAGHQEVFREIVERHQQGLANFFRKMGLAADADDLVQETFIKLYKYRDRYEPRAKFTSFLYMIARQMRLDHLRKVKRRTVLTGALEDASKVSEQNPSGAERAGKPDVDRLLSGLSEEMREAVVLSIYRGMKYHEITELTGVPVGTIKSRVFSAMRKMREMLEAGH